MDVNLTNEEIVDALPHLSDLARTELIALVYKARWEKATADNDKLRHAISIHEENARIEREKGNQ